jgi:hypothetical protein
MGAGLVDRSSKRQVVGREISPLLEATRLKYPGMIGESWMMDGAMLCRTPEPFTKGWTGSFKRYTGPIIILDEFVDEEEIRDDDELSGRAWRVLTSHGIYFIAFGWLDQVATKIGKDETRRPESSEA